MIEVQPETRIGGTAEVLAIQARFKAAEDAGDALTMAKCLSEELHVRVSFEPRADERQNLLAARAQLRQQVPELGSMRSMAKSLARPTVEPKAAASTEREPSPQLVMAQLRRDIAVAGSLATARSRFAKCIAQGDGLGSINAMNCQLSAQFALAKSEADRDRFSTAKQKLYTIAHAAGFEMLSDGSYGLAKSAAAANNAKAFDQMYRTLSELLDRSPAVATIRAEIEKLRNDIVARALAYGCRLKNGKFVPYAS